jgi:RNA polymerase sigma-54 factor
MSLSIQLKLKNSLKLSPNIEQSVNLLKANELEIEYLISEFLSKNPYLDLDDSDRVKINSLAYSLDNLQDSENELLIYGYGLKDYLENNLFDLGLDYEEESIANLLIDYIDDNGYLTEDYGFFINEASPEIIIDENTLNTIILKLNQISSPGIGARNLSECLIFQLDQFKSNSISIYSKKIAKNYLKELGNKNFEKISKELGISMDEVLKCNELIISLNPKPGLAYGNNKNSEFVFPDIKVSKENQSFKISISNNYESLKLIEISEKDILNSEEYNQAKWFLKNINYRKINIIRVAQYIFQYHKNFLKNKSLEFPFTVKMVANELEIHESTVSRMINSKYIETPFGIFQMKYFFTHEVNNFSDNLIKKRIKEIVDSENKLTPLSDTKINLTLHKERITISRRTIAKYRDQLGILPASKRKVC